MSTSNEKAKHLFQPTRNGDGINTHHENGDLHRDSLFQNTERDTLHL